MPETTQDKVKPAAPGPANLIKAQERSTALFARAGELMVDAGRAVLESQMDLVKVEAEQAAKAFVPLEMGDDPGKALAAFSERWHGSSDRMVTHMRRIDDVVRDCGWQLLATYADGLRQAMDELHFQPWPHSGRPDRA